MIGQADEVHTETPFVERVRRGRPKQEEREEVKRYSLILPASIAEDVERYAKEHSLPVAELLRRFVKLGILAMDLSEEEDAGLQIREGDRVREIIVL